MRSSAYLRDRTVDDDSDTDADSGLVRMSGPRSIDTRQRTRVLVASSQPSVRQRLCALLAHDPDFDIIAEAENGGTAMRLARQLRPDVVLVDMLMPDLDGIATTRMIRSEAATRQVDVISQRESEVMGLVAQGLANKQIARDLGISQSTVKSHIGSLLNKLDLRSRTQLALYAARASLVTLELSGNMPTTRFSSGRAGFGLEKIDKGSAASYENEQAHARVLKGHNIDQNRLGVDTRQRLGRYSADVRR